MTKFVAKLIYKYAMFILKNKTHSDIIAMIVGGIYPLVSNGLRNIGNYDKI